MRGQHQREQDQWAPRSWSHPSGDPTVHCSSGPGSQVKGVSSCVLTSLCPPCPVVGTPWTKAPRSKEPNGKEPILIPSLFSQELKRRAKSLTLESGVCSPPGCRSISPQLEVPPSPCLFLEAETQRRVPPSLPCITPNLVTHDEEAVIAF